MLEKPAWLRKRLPIGLNVQKMESDLTQHGLHSICQEACCPNLGECFNKGEAAFLVMGDVCTRNCRFCAVASGIPKPIDPLEPLNLAKQIRGMELNFVVVTSVTRDDLPDGGAYHFAEVVLAIQKICPGVGVEVLVPDFQGSTDALTTVITSRPNVLNHNVETVPRLYSGVRPQARYTRSVELLRQAKKIDSTIVTKSGLMAGLGETRDEVLHVMDDLRDADCDLLTIGQYLQPSKDHHPVIVYVLPDVFHEYEFEALERGFKGVVASPFVRSSYRAGELYRSINMHKE